MPPIKVQHVISFSSEDQVHKAENLLRSETYRKWKCSNPGEKQASVVLQFEKASVINSIDIGNESSAFVEVLVARSSDVEPDFKVLLVASSFMSPMESRQGSNLNRVRMFGPEKLSQPVAKEKWDRVKLVCTQPFSKSLQYGLTFVTFHSPEEPKSAPSPKENKPEVKVGGKFLLKDEEEAEDTIQIGSLFAKQQTTKTGDMSTSPAAIRDASYASATLSKAEERIPRLAEKAKLPKAKTSSSAPEPQTAKAACPSTPAQKAQKQELSSSQYTERRPAASLSKPSKPRRPFGELMKGVRFVLSGFQNPARSQIRDKAIEMGARYTGDWDNMCTHLVCAFVNTPKYNQVKQLKGRIVKKEWILDSYNKKALQPWRDYILGTCDRPNTPEPNENMSRPSTSSVRLDDPVTATRVDKRSRSDMEGRTPTKTTDRPSAATPSKMIRVQGDDRKAEEDASTAQKSTADMSESGSSDYEAPTDCDDDIDTDDEIERALQRSYKATEQKQSNASNAEVSSTGNVLRELPSPANLPALPDIFEGKPFHILGDVLPDERRDLTRCIVGHDGDLKDKLEASAKFVITRSDWCHEFDEALAVNEDIVFVRPEWIFKCHERGKLVPYQPFVVIREET